jgi:release factor glutamine methyltransferase
MTLGQALQQVGQQGLDRLDAQRLLLHVLAPGQARDRAWLLAHDQDLLPAHLAQAFLALVQRRLAGEPLAYLTGERGFFGLSLHVDARVLDPRPDTETLVEWALERLDAVPSAQRPVQVLDMGTGSGAIALALQHHCPWAQVSAVDASAEALAVAQANELRLRQAPMTPIAFYQGSWFQPVTANFDLIVSNPPYIAEGDPHLPALRFEPHTALVSGPDGLSDLRHLINQAPHHLKPGGGLLLEHGWDQALAVRQLLTQAGFEQVNSRKDLAGIERCSGGVWPDSR